MRPNDFPIEDPQVILPHMGLPQAGREDLSSTWELKLHPHIVSQKAKKIECPAHCKPSYSK